MYGSLSREFPVRRFDNDDLWQKSNLVTKKALPRLEKKQPAARAGRIRGMG